MYLRISRISFTIYANASQLLVKNYHTHTKRIPCLVGSGNEEVLKITHNGVAKACDLFNSHEESDSKIIIIHAVSSDKVLRNQIEMRVLGLIIIFSDTDVLMYTTTNIYAAELWVYIGNVTITADKKIAHLYTI